MSAPAKLYINGHYAGDAIVELGDGVQKIAIDSRLHPTRDGGVRILINDKDVTDQWLTLTVVHDDPGATP